MPVFFHNADIKFSVPQKSKLEWFISAQVFMTAKKVIRFTYVFCSDEYLIGINKKFLSSDYYTDIITFPLSETETRIEAEIYISIDRVKENAQIFRVNFNDELNRVMFHGALHLIGFKDKTKTDKTLMQRMENEWLSQFGKDNS